jgi:hypothetical protein
MKGERYVTGLLNDDRMIISPFRTDIIPMLKLNEVRKHWKYFNEHGYGYFKIYRLVEVKKGRSRK